MKNIWAQKGADRIEIMTATEQELHDSENWANGRTSACFCAKLRQFRGIPDSRWSFVILLAGFVSVAIVNGCLYSFGVLLPELMDNFQETRARTATVGSMGTCVGYALSPFTSLSCERFGFRATVLVSSLVLIVALGASAASPSLALLYFTYGILGGIGFSVSHNISVVMVMKHFVKWRAFSSGIIQSAFGFGMLFVSQTTQKLIDWYGWRWALGSWAVLAFVLFSCGTVYDGQETKHSKRETRECNEKRKHRMAVITKLKLKQSVPKNWLLLLYCFSFALSNMVFYVPIIYMVKFSEKHLAIPRDDSAQLYIYFSVVVIFSRNMYCKLGCFVNRFLLYQLSAGLTGLAIILLPFSTSYTHLVVFMLCLGLFDGGIWGLAALLVTDIAGIENLNFAWGIFNSAVSVAVCGPPLAGLIADKCDSYVPAFIASGATLIFASCLMFLRNWAHRHTYNNQQCRGILLLNDKNDEILKIFERETVL